MNLEQYAAQQGAPQAQHTQSAEALTVEQMAAKMDAEKLSFLMAEAQAALDDQQTPAAILTRLYSDLFGENSTQAADLAAILDRAATPGGHELAIAQNRQRRQLLKRQAKQLAEMQKEIAKALTALDETERELSHAEALASALDAALTEAATFTKQIDDESPDKVITRATALYNQHRNSPPAMGLLYGTLSEAAAGNALVGRFNLYQLQQLESLRRDVLQALQG